MGGYGARKEYCSGVYDDLYARAVYLQGSKTGKVLFLALDLVGLNRKYGDLLKRQLCRACPSLKPEDIVIHCTHTHSAWESLGVLGEPHKFFIDGIIRARFRVPVFRELVHRIVAMIKKVLVPENIFEGRMGFLKTRTPEALTWNRRKRKPEAQELVIIKLEDLRGKLRGLLFNFGAHGTTVGHRNTLQSAEWMGEAVRHLRASLPDPGTFVMLLVGASGDIAPAWDGKDVDWGPFSPPRREFQFMTMYGRRIAELCLPSYENITCRDVEVVTAPIRELFVKAGPFLRSNSPRDLLRYLGLNLKYNFLKGLLLLSHGSANALASLVKIQGERGYFLQTWIQVVTLDDFTILCSPGETFTSIRDGIYQKVVDSSQMMMIGFANDYASYLFPLGVLYEGGYEPQFQFAPRAGDVVKNELLKLLRDLEFCNVDSRTGIHRD